MYTVSSCQCHICEKVSSDIEPCICCNRCTVVYYCSPECEEKDSSRHALECKKLQTVTVTIHKHSQPLTYTYAKGIERIRDLRAFIAAECKWSSDKVILCKTSSCKHALGWGYGYAKDDRLWFPNQTTLRAHHSGQSCDICMHQLYEPVQLVCTHTICGPCLIDVTGAKMVSCPVCHDDIDNASIPEEAKEEGNVNDVDDMDHDVDDDHDDDEKSNDDNSGIESKHSSNSVLPYDYQRDKEIKELYEVHRVAVVVQYSAAFCLIPFANTNRARFTEGEIDYRGVLTKKSCVPMKRPKRHEDPKLWLYPELDPTLGIQVFAHQGKCYLWYFTNERGFGSKIRRFTDTKHVIDQLATFAKEELRASETECAKVATHTLFSVHDFHDECSLSVPYPSMLFDDDDTKTTKTSVTSKDMDKSVRIYKMELNMLHILRGERVQYSIWNDEEEAKCSRVIPANVPEMKTWKELCHAMDVLFVDDAKFVLFNPRSTILQFLPYYYARQYLDQTYTFHQWDEVERLRYSREGVTKYMRNRLDFLREKMEDGRYLSIANALVQLKTLCWLLGDDNPWHRDNPYRLAEHMTVHYLKEEFDTDFGCRPSSDDE